ncbi:MAG: cupin domain-containing protein [Thermoflexales bacterium]|nr:cupin domain-containing protein [Thermoflexales bacterium]
MSLRVVNISQTIQQVDQPFTLTELAVVGEMAVHGYICLGAVNWHAHIDADELFLVLEGAMALESQWGDVLLHSGEMAVVPKGIAHRSGSQWRTLVVLVHARGFPERKNGHRRLFGFPGQGQMNKVELLAMTPLAGSFRLEPVADVDEYVVQLTAGRGLSPSYVNFLSDTLWLVTSGQVRFEAGDELVELSQGELIVIPRDLPHRWIGLGSATLLWLGLAQATA